MARFDFKLPDVGEGVAEAEIVQWHVLPGDTICEDQPFVDVLTDKATVEITSPVAGRVVSLQGEAGSVAAVGSILAILETDLDADVTPAAGLSAATPPPDSMPPPGPAAAPEAPSRAASGAAAARPLAAPSTRQRARDAGVRLEDVRGSGPAGRVIAPDLERHLATVRAGGRVRQLGVETVKVIGIGRRIADRMSESKRRIPHFSYVEEVDVSELEALRSRLNARGEGPRLTVLPFLASALVAALADHPGINAIYDDEAGELHRHDGVHLGVATQTDAGLLVPVLPHAEALGLWALAEGIRQVSGDARAGKATRQQLSGSTITLTSLGALGGVATTPVINPPEVAIIGPNRIVERPVAIGGQVVVRKMMNLSSSFDHRVVDGWAAAAFAQTLKGFLEHPAMIFAGRP